MTYNEFINSLSGIISLFVNGLNTLASALIHNYFFITILGLVIFTSLFWLVYYFLSSFIDNKINKYEEYNDLYENYVLKKEVQSDYLDNHYEDEFDYVYRKKLLDLQVMNGVYQNNKDLVYDYYVLKKQVQSDYLDNNYQDEFDYVYRKKLLGLQVMNDLYVSQRELIIDNKIHNIDCNIEALKRLKQMKLSDNDNSNDNDVDMVVPNPPIQMASVSELKNKPMSYDELHSFDEELRNDIKNNIDSLEKEFSR